MYAPNEDSPDFFAKVFAELAEYSESDKIVAGDLNVTLDEKLDYRSRAKIGRHNKQVANLLNQIIDQEGWCDVWRIRNPDKFQYTWKRTKPICMSRLDYILVPQHFLSSVTSCEIKSTISTDHLAVDTEIDLVEMQRGKGFWKMNNTHLYDKEYVDSVNEILDFANYRYDALTKSLKWEMIKIDVSEYSIYHGRNVASRKKKEKEELKKKLATQEKRMACINLDAPGVTMLIEKINAKIDQLKAALEKIENQNTKGAMLRSRATYYELGEKNSKYIFNLEVSNAKMKVMKRIKDEEGKIISKPQEVLAEQKEFYKKLCTANSKVHFEMPFESESIVDEEMKDKLDQPLQLSELAETLKTTKRNKTPRPCGISADFYIVFWNKIRQHMLEAFNECLEVKRIFPSGRRGIISLIPKQGRGSMSLKNWRPIILLCTDYKILLKVISNTIKTCLHKLIHPDQSGFMSGQNINMNIRRIIDTIDYTREHNINSLLISQDFSKAFDHVEYNSLLGAIKWFNFGPKITSWVEVLFRDFSLCTVNNGFCSEYFTPTRGLFQDNPISSQGFLIIIELLAVMLRRNENIKGIKIAHLKNLITMFADDVNLFLQNKEKEWKEVEYVIYSFHLISGLKINYEKSTVYQMGNRDGNAQYYSMRKLQWSDRPPKVLGIFVTDDNKEFFDLNLQPTLENSKVVINVWKARNLSLIGKIVILNTLISSIFTHILVVCSELLKSFLQTFNMMCKDFIWNYGKAKISLEILQSNKDQGGLGLVNLMNKDKSVKIQWIKKIIEEENELMRIFAYQAIQNPIGHLIWETNLKKQDIKTLTDRENFWTSVLSIWSEFNFQSITAQEQIRKQIIWFNSKIGIQDKVIFYKKWFEAGIRRIKDLFSEQGVMKSIKQIEQEYHIYPTFTELYRIFSAIPVTWKRWLRSSNDYRSALSNLDRIITFPSVTRNIYRILNEKERVLEKTLRKWQNSYLPSLEYDELERTIRNLYSITNCVKLRSFQYRFFLKAVVTNIQFYYYKIREDSLCYFCEVEKESIKHLFYDCNLV